MSTLRTGASNWLRPVLKSAFLPRACSRQLTTAPRLCGLQSLWSVPPSKLSPMRRVSTHSQLAHKFYSTGMEGSTNNENRPTDSKTEGSQEAGPEEAEQNVKQTHPIVSTHLFVIAGMTFAIVIVGGLTRLTESGLSITEWNVISGVLPPLSQADWEAEFDKYRQTPEWRQQNRHMTVDEFKQIYVWEWGHRLLGRTIGLAFVLPIPIFIKRNLVSNRIKWTYFGLAALIGAQGALGWYMVKSGLDQEKVNELGGVARVSQYRLASHLALAFILFAACLRTGLTIRRDYTLLHKLGKDEALKAISLLNTPQANTMRKVTNALALMVFTTAISGAFVAGLDAGLVYNDFPFMGGRLIPPFSELFSDQFARLSDKTDKYWRNIFENPTTVQFDHRLLATTTFASICAAYFYARKIRSFIPRKTFSFVTGTLHMSVIQVGLGISTLLLLVPVPLAATHQGGSLVLLSMAIASAASLRRVSPAMLKRIQSRH